jgi:cation diffusion facilitator family transporter
VGHGHPHAHGQRILSVRVALATYGVILVLKLAAWQMTGLLVLLAEAFHTMTDLLMTSFLLVAARLASLPPDEAHPFGHARGENLAGMVASIVFITLIGAELVREAVPRLLAPGSARQPLVAVIVLLASGALTLLPLVLARRDMGHGGVVRAQAVESLNDLVGIGAGLVGVALVAAGYPAADPLASLAVAVIIIYNGIQLFRHNVPYLVGASPPHDFYESVRKVALATRGALGVHSMAAEYVGPNAIHLDMHLTVDGELTIEAADKLAHKVRDKLEHELEVSHVTIHFCASEGELRRVGRDAEGRRPAAAARKPR